MRASNGGSGGSGSGVATLPLELGGISDERRVQLEGRRQREMARQQEQQERVAGNGNFRWSPIAMIPAHLCVLIFLVFLLEKLEGSTDWPWATVLCPLWITDAVFIVIKVGGRSFLSCRRCWGFRLLCSLLGTFLLSSLPLLSVHPFGLCGVSLHYSSSHCSPRSLC